MIKITDKTKCCGCTACASVCPQKCISMEPDFEGFLYPQIAEQKCLNCGLCNKVCPVENKIHIDYRDIHSFAVRTKDREILKNSTSGGFFTPLANWVINEKGVVCAAAYDEKFEIKHTFIDGQKSGGYCGLERFRGSKYVQSGLDDCYSKIKELLLNGRKVCFVGTPCQVRGLKCFLQKEYSNLLTVDLVCKGVSSPKLWKKYIGFQTEKFSSQIESISFRSKVFGYHSRGFMNIRFSNGKTYLASGRVDFMLKSFHKDISSRPICYECPFKQKLRCSDLTIYDCWHFSQLANKPDDDLGYTNIIVQSSAGMKTLQELNNVMEIISVDTDNAIKANGIMLEKSAQPHPNRSNFYKQLDSQPLPVLIQRYIPITIKDYVIEWGKILLYRMKILQKVKVTRLK